MELYKKHDVMVVSDEIWSDIILGGHRHIPTQSVSEDARSRTVAVYAPSKTFNLAGLVGSYHIIYNPVLRDRVEKEASLSHYNSMNVLSMHALLGAYRPEGYEWVDELCQVLTANVDFACDFIARRFEGVEVSRPQGTYMLFLDCTRWCEAHGKSIEALQRAGWDVGVRRISVCWCWMPKSSCSVRSMYLQELNFILLFTGGGEHNVDFIVQRPYFSRLA